MAPSPESRKRRFRSALALADMTAAEFAEINGVTPAHLSFVLSGKRTSARILEAIDRFIATVSKREVAA